MTTQPLTDHQLDEIAGRAAGLYEYATGLDDAWQDESDQLTGTDVPALIAEVRRLHAELDAAPGKALAMAADAVDRKLTAEPDHNRASALYELLLQLRAMQPCTCARSQGLHEKSCRKYVPGHELLSPVNALAAYRAERTSQPPAPAV